MQPLSLAQIEHDRRDEERAEAARRRVQFVLEHADGHAYVAVASLESDTIAVHVKLAEHADRVLRQAHSVATTLRAFDQAAYNSEVAKKTTLEADCRAFRSELFAAADLPAEPDSTWDAFVAAGGAYRSHLSEVDAHDADRCLYCRQTLNDAARRLVSKYSDYLQDEISPADSRDQKTGGQHVVDLWS